MRAVPALLADTDAAALLRDLTEDLADVGRSRRVEDAADAVLARLACHSAVRVGHQMGAQQIRALLVAMDHVDFSGNCPHGRPAYVAADAGRSRALVQAHVSEWRRAAPVAVCRIRARERVRVREGLRAQPGAESAHAIDVPARTRARTRARSRMR